MASAKTRPTDTPVATLLDAIDDPQRAADCRRVAELMREVTGQAPVVWGSAIVGFGEHETSTGPWPVLAFAARKKATVLYLNDSFEEPDPLLARLGRHKVGTGCLYIDRLEQVDETVLVEVLRRAVDGTPS